MVVPPPLGPFVLNEGQAYVANQAQWNFIPQDRLDEETAQAVFQQYEAYWQEAPVYGDDDE